MDTLCPIILVPGNILLTQSTLKAYYHKLADVAYPVCRSTLTIPDTN